MATDFYDQLPNFVNPAYATPEQLRASRAYAEALMKRAGEPITRPAGALAAMIDQLTSNAYRNQAIRQEQGMYGQNLGDIGYAAALQDQSPRGPYASAEQPAIASQNPALVGGADIPRRQAEDARNAELLAAGKNYDGSPSVNLTAQMASLGPEGGGPASAAPPVGAPPPASPPGVAGGAAPTFRDRYNAAFPQMAQNTQQPPPGAVARMLMNPSTPPELRAQLVGTMQQAPGADVFGQPTLGSVRGGIQPQAAGQGLQFGVQRPITVGPEGMSTTYPAVAPGRGGGGAAGAGGIVPPAVLEGATQAANQLRMNAAGSGAMAEFKKSDLVAANDAPLIKRVAGTMLDDLRVHGDKMTFGPTAEWSNNVKRLAANYVPGVMKDQIESLASADSFDKMSAQLTSLLAKGGGTDAQLFNNMKSVPGAHNSKEGAEALLKMTIQVANQQQQLADFVAPARTPEQYRALKDQFYKQNPIINPISGNPISLDMQKGVQEGGGGFKVLKVH